jgi:hypothetical protein
MYGEDEKTIQKMAKEVLPKFAYCMDIQEEGHEL